MKNSQKILIVTISKYDFSAFSSSFNAVYKIDNNYSLKFNGLANRSIQETKEGIISEIKKNGIEGKIEFRIGRIEFVNGVTAFVDKSKVW